jgi:penicillin-binding protein 1A
MLGSLAGVLLVAVAGIGAAGWVLSVASSAPNINQLKPRVPGQLSEVFASNGDLLGYLSSDVIRSPVAEHVIPLELRQATVAIEDRRFWSHGGVDYEGILRAAIKDLFEGGGIQGGSTLTMQLVNNVYLPENVKAHHNVRYKIIQAKLANQLASEHTKNWILTQYLNDVPYGTTNGQTAIGVAAASQMFFDKPVGQIDLAQAALLAGLPQAPSEYNPFLYPGVARSRRTSVLKAMYSAGYITQPQEQAAIASPLQVHPNDAYQTVQQPYVFEYVQQQLVAKLGQATVDRGGLKIHTTINLADQTYAQQALEANESMKDDPGAALVSVNPANGQIVSMAQNTTYGVGPGQTTFNYGTQIKRQTGSSFKPFVLMTLIHDYDGNPNSTYYDSHFLAPGWLPGYPSYSVATSELTYQGDISITHAMTVSDNTVFAQLGVDLGMTKVDAMAHAMGITAPLFGNPAEAIGGLKIGVSPLQMADAYSTIDDGGVHHPWTIFTDITLPSGKTLNFGDPKGTRVFSPGEAYAGTQVLQTVVEDGTGTAANYGCPAAGKTGTTNNYTDAWFVGYTPNLVTAVWVGYPSAEIPMNDINGLGPGFGGTLSAPIWHDFMEKASPQCEQFAYPADPFYGVQYIGAHSLTGPCGSTTTPGTTTPGTTTTTPLTVTSSATSPTGCAPATKKKKGSTGPNPGGSTTQPGGATTLPTGPPTTTTPVTTVTTGTITAPGGGGGGGGGL